MAVFVLRLAQRLTIQRFIAENSPYAEQPFSLRIGAPERMAGVNLGRALLELDREGLCGHEEPDTVRPTAVGLAEARRIA